MGFIMFNPLIQHPALHLHLLDVGDDIYVPPAVHRVAAVRYSLASGVTILFVADFGWRDRHSRIVQCYQLASWWVLQLLCHASHLHTTIILLS